MRRSKVGAKLSVVYHQTVAVAYAGVQLKLLGIHALRKVFYQRPAFFVGYFSRRIIYHGPVKIIRFIRQGEYIAAYGYIRGREFHPHADRFQRRAATIVNFGVVAHYRKICGIGLRGHSLWHHVCHAADAVGCYIVHIGLIGRLQGGSVSEGGDWPVRHAVSQHYYVFHMKDAFR